jgi:hypothetical protein
MSPRGGGGGGQARRDPGREHRPHHVDDGHGHRPRRDGNSGTDTWTIFYSWVAPVPESRRVRDGYFFHPRVTRRVPDTLLPL